jgi:hypothetical protein
LLFWLSLLLKKALSLSPKDVFTLSMPEEVSAPAPVVTQNPQESFDPMAGLPDPELPAVRVNPGCKGVRKKYRKRVTPAGSKKAERMIKKLVADTLPAVAEGLESEAALGRRTSLEYAKLSQSTKAAILSLLGEDIDAAKAQFADYLLAGARRMAGLIVEQADELPPGQRAFALSVLIDKSEALRGKMASTAAGAKVNIQINNFGDGVDRDQLIKDLHPEINVTPPPPPKDAA